MYRTLIADDEDLERKALHQVVADSCPRITEVHEAANGLEALAIWRACQPDIILCDIRMPGLSGMELAREIRAGGNKQVLVFITACAEFNFAREAVSLGASDYLLKPVDDEVLADQMDHLCQILDERYGRVPVPVPGRSRDLNPRVQALMAEADAIMERQFADPIGLEDVALAVGLSPCYFSKTFRTWKGLTFVDQLNHLRLNHAEALLGDFHLSIKEIAPRAGFQDANYFARVFRSTYGCSPTDWRASLVSSPPTKDKFVTN